MWWRWRSQHHTVMLDDVDLKVVVDVAARECELSPLSSLIGVVFFCSPLSKSESSVVAAAAVAVRSCADTTAANGGDLRGIAGFAWCRSRKGYWFASLQNSRNSSVAMPTDWNSQGLYGQ